jgi:hypothetical protein
VAAELGACGKHNQPVDGFQACIGGLCYAAQVLEPEAHGATTDAALARAQQHERVDFVERIDQATGAVTGHGLVYGRVLGLGALVGVVFVHLELQGGKTICRFLAVRHVAVANKCGACVAEASLGRFAQRPLEAFLI